MRRPVHRWQVALVRIFAVVLALVSFGSIDVVVRVGDNGWWLVPLIAAAGGLPFALAFTRPFVGWLVSAGAAAAIAWGLPVADANPWPWPPIHGLVLLALLCSVGMRERSRRLAFALVATAVLFGYGVHPNAAVAWVLVVLGVAAFGLLVGRLASTEGELARQAELSEAEKSRRVVLEERARIARDLHDIVAHRMSLIAVQAETAPYRVAGLSEEARAELVAIAGDARTALAETRVLLSVLRQEDEQARYAPQPGVDDLPTLVEGSRRAGVEVGMSGTVPPDRLSPAVSLAVYRIVQEAMANAVRHAPGSAIAVELSLEGGSEGDQVVIHVRNSAAPGAAGSTRAATAGHGITGIHERVAALGGAVTLGPSADGGFTVDAVLPCLGRAEPDGDGSA